MKNTIIALGLISFIVVVAMAYGFYLTGGPGMERKRQLDQRKLVFISEMATEVTTAFIQSKSLPESLDQLQVTENTPLLAGKVTLDDVTYSPLDNDRFELCAIFETEKVGSTRQVFTDTFEVQQAAHGVGKKCFVFDAIATATLSTPYEKELPSTDVKQLEPVITDEIQTVVDDGLSCTQDSECAIATCTCKPINLNFITAQNGSCMRECRGKPKCNQGRCIVDDEKL